MENHAKYLERWSHTFIIGFALGCGIKVITLTLGQEQREVGNFFQGILTLTYTSIRENSIQKGRQARPEIDPDTYRLSVFMAEPLNHWWRPLILGCTRFQKKYKTLPNYLKIKVKKSIFLEKMCNIIEQDKIELTKRIYIYVCEREKERKICTKRR